MREKKRRKLFWFDTIDYRAAEAWLNEQAAQGWELEGIWPGPVAVFNPARRRDLQYAVAVDPTGGKGEREEAYLQLMEDAGWHKVERKPGIYIFASVPGVNPAPLQTDPELEQKQFYQYLRRGWIASLVILIIVATLLAAYFFVVPAAERTPLFSFESLLEDNLVVSALALPLLLIYLVLSGASHLRYWRAGKRAIAAGSELPATSRRAAQARQIIAAVAAVLCVGGWIMGFVQTARRESVTFQDGLEAVAQAAETAPVLRAEDLGKDGWKPLSLDRTPGILLDRVSYSELADRTLITERFECRAAGLARWFAEDMVRAGVTVDVGGYYRPSIFPMEAVELGFEQSWICIGEGWSQILLREGNVVAVVNGPLDLSDPALPDILRERLQLH